MRWLALAMGLAVFASSSAAAQHGFPATREAITAVLCSGHRSCRVEWVLYAGRHRGVPYAVARVRRGGGCVEERAYYDELIAMHNDEVERQRTLVIGREPCLEWQLSSWRRSGDELLFEYGMMGAPILMPPGSTGRSVLRIRPWPLAIVSATDGTSPIATPPTPAHGPLVVLTME
jgi:hypothetical protein